MAHIDPTFIIGTEVEKESKHIFVRDQTLNYAETLNEEDTGYASTEFIRAIFVFENNTIKPSLSQLTGFGMEYQYPVLNNRRYKTFMYFIPVYDDAQEYPVGVIVYKDGGFYKKINNDAISYEPGEEPEIRASVTDQPLYDDAQIELWQRLTIDDFAEFDACYTNAQAGSLVYPVQSIQQAVSFSNTDWQDYSLKKIAPYRWQISDDSNVPGARGIRVLDVEQNELEPAISFSIESGETKEINLGNNLDGVYLVKIYNGSIEEMRDADPNSEILIEESTKWLVIYEYSKVNDYVHQAMKEVYTKKHESYQGVMEQYKRSRNVMSSFKIYSFFLTAMSTINFERFEYIEHYMLTNDRYSVIKLADKYIRKSLEMATNYKDD